ncbi:MFS domain-containing protein [Favolaschia claudopus]|uniref:MFS domain-containing protein n=1 Tax=Favolaschia claudopus TaxID=2862362 RepID=A0AAW0E243_9AGAR
MSHSISEERLPTPTTPLEKIPIPELADVQPANTTQIRQHKMKERIQLFTLCWVLFLAGWNDGSLGPLLPRIQEFYHIGYTIVSLIFVLQCVGCIFGAVINISLSQRYGLGKLLVFGSCLQIVAYPLQAAALPFPVFVIAAVINGAGLAIQDAQANAYVASLADNSETKMGFVQAAYGLGALIAPLVSTQFAQLQHWSFHYLVSLGVTALNTIFLVAAFRGKTIDECLAQIGQDPTHDDSEEQNEKSHFQQILSHKAVHLLGVFLLVYVGVEVTNGGWIVSYMITVRGGGPSTGYVSAGYFGGLTLGRVLLLPVNKWIGERPVIYLYGLIAIGLELVIWLVPSLVGDSIAAAFMGVVLGPIYPIAMNHAGRVFPRRLLTGSIGWIAGIATTGSAIIPFIVGAIASKAGIKNLVPVVVSMMAVMLVLWAIVPDTKIEGSNVDRAAETMESTDEKQAIPEFVRNE